MSRLGVCTLWPTSPHSPTRFTLCVTLDLPICSAFRSLHPCFSLSLYHGPRCAVVGASGLLLLKAHSSSASPHTQILYPLPPALELLKYGTQQDLLSTHKCATWNCNRWWSPPCLQPIWAESQPSNSSPLHPGLFRNAEASHNLPGNVWCSRANPFILQLWLVQ